MGRVIFIVSCLLLYAAPARAQEPGTTEGIIERYMSSKLRKKKKKRFRPSSRVKAQLKAVLAPQDVPYLAEMLRTTKDPGRRQLAAWALMELRYYAFEALVACLEHPDKDVRLSAAWALGTSNPECFPDLAEVARYDPSGVVRLTALQSIGKMAPNTEEAQPLIIAVLQSDPEDKVREVAASTLAQVRWGAKRSVPALVRALQEDSSVRVRVVAAASLGRLGGKAAPAIPALARSTRAEHPSERRAAVEALEKLGPFAKEAVPDLIRAMEDPDRDVRRAAVSALGRAGDSSDEVTNALLGVLHDGDRTVRTKAAERLGQLYGEGVWVLILRLFWQEALGLFIILAAWFGIFGRWPRHRPRSSIRHGLLVALVINVPLFVVPAYLILVAVTHDWLEALGEKLPGLPLIIAAVLFLLLMLTCLGLSLWVCGRRKRAPRMEGDEDDLDEPLPGISTTPAV